MKYKNLDYFKILCSFLLKLIKTIIFKNFIIYLKYKIKFMYIKFWKYDNKYNNIKRIQINIIILFILFIICFEILKIIKIELIKYKLFINII